MKEQNKESVNKTLVHQELTLRYKEFFESKLAVTLLQRPEIFSAVKKISKNIHALLEEHKADCLRIILDCPKIKVELYGHPYFGRLNSNPEPGVAISTAIFQDICKTLENAQSELSQIMQIHAIFIYRIYPQLIMNDVQRQMLKNSHALLPKDRGRQEITGNFKPCTHFGITRNKVFSKMVGGEAVSHVRAVEKFIPNCQSHFFKEIQLKNIPFVAGASSHTATLISGAMALGLHDIEDLKEYAMACFAFLAGGGNHSFHEVMVVANKAGVPYTANDYSASFPDAFKEFEIFQALSTGFPEFLSSFEFMDAGARNGKKAAMPFEQNLSPMHKNGMR